MMTVLQAARAAYAAGLSLLPTRSDGTKAPAVGLLGGREGIGKSMCAYTLAADVTRGRLPGAYAGVPRSVLVAATEDSWSHTIVPRLMAAEADLARVYRIDVLAPDGTELVLTLPQDTTGLADVARTTNPSLIVFDTVALPDRLSHRYP